MKVYVKLYAGLTHRLPESLLAQYPAGIRAGYPLEIELPENSTIEKLLVRLSLNRKEVIAVFVNAKARELDHRLASEDQLGIFPPIGGDNGGDNMDRIRVEVWLYGPLSRYGDNTAVKSHAKLEVKLKAGSVILDLLKQLSLPTEERGITFINANLSALPGLQEDLGHPLQDGDRVAFFHLKSMWPFQYRHGAALAPGLAGVLDKRPFHHQPNR